MLNGKFIGRVGGVVFFRIECEIFDCFQRKFYFGIGLRVGLNGKFGFFYIIGIYYFCLEFEKFVEWMIKLVKVSEVFFRGFFVLFKVFEVKGIYDRKIEEIFFEDVYVFVFQYVEKMRELKEKEIFLGLIFLVFERYGVVNFNGVEFEVFLMYMGVFVYVVREDILGNGLFYQSYCFFQGIEVFEEVIMKVKEDVELSVRVKRFEFYEGEVVLELEVVLFIVEVFFENFYGDEVYYGRSRFFSFGDRVVLEDFIFLDDLMFEGFLGSYFFDGEGIFGQRIILIENGILKGFFFDYIYVFLFGFKSIGNVVRSFRIVLLIGLSNFVVEFGKEGLEDFEGIIIKNVFGEYIVNLVSGDFLFLVGFGYVVRDGEFVFFKDNMFVGNVFDFLKMVEFGKVIKRIFLFMVLRVKVYVKIV